MKFKVTLFVYFFLACNAVFAMQLAMSVIDYDKEQKNISNVEKIQSKPSQTYQADLKDGSRIIVSDLESGLECKKFASKDSTEFEELDSEYFYFIAALYRDNFKKTK